MHRLTSLWFLGDSSFFFESCLTIVMTIVTTDMSIAIFWLRASAGACAPWTLCHIPLSQDVASSYLGDDFPWPEDFVPYPFQRASRAGCAEEKNEKTHDAQPQKMRSDVFRCCSYGDFHHHFLDSDSNSWIFDIVTLVFLSETTSDTYGGLAAFFHLFLIPFHPFSPRKLYKKWWASRARPPARYSSSLSMAPDQSTLEMTRMDAASKTKAGQAHGFSQQVQLS